MPGSTENLMYSFDLGPVHFIAFTTEAYYFLNYGIKTLIKQYEWLEQDLIEANKPDNRYRLLYLPLSKRTDNHIPLISFMALRWPENRGHGSSHMVIDRCIAVMLAIMIVNNMRLFCGSVCRSPISSVWKIYSTITGLMWRFGHMNILTSDCGHFTITR